MPKYTIHNTVKSGLRADVWLDGDPVQDVIEADTDDGYILRYCKNEAGNIVLSPDGKTIETERLTGRVEVKTEPFDANA